jgi:hypothetical protein
MQWEYNTGTAAAPSWVFITGNTPVCSGSVTVTCTSTVTITGTSGASNPSTNAFANAAQLNVQATDATGTATDATSDTLTVLTPATWYTTGSTLQAIEGSERSALLLNGDVLAIGYPDTSINLYTSAASAWVLSNKTIAATLRPTVTLLPNGTVLIAGGSTASGDTTATTIFTEGTTPGTNDATAAGAVLNTARDSHTATLLADGTVLVAGGIKNGLVLNTAEVLKADGSAWTATTGNMQSARYRAAATLLPSGLVLVSGGQSSLAIEGALASAETYNPQTGTWAATCPMNTPRYFHTSTLLPNGMVLITGGVNANNGTLASAEIFNPAGVNSTGSCTGTFTAVSSSMIAARSQHSATLQADGTVLIAGGSGSNGILKSAEIFTPATSTFASTGSLTVARDGQSAVLMQNGSTLVAGGTGATGAAVKSTEYFVNTSNVQIPSPAVTISGGLATCTSGLTNDPNQIYTWTLTGAAGTITSPYSNAPTILFTTGALPTLNCMVTSGLGISAVGSATVTNTVATTATVGQISETYTSSTVTNTGVAAPTFEGNSYVIAGQNAFFSTTANSATPGVTWLYFNTATNAWVLFPQSIYTQPAAANSYKSVLTINNIPATANGLQIMAVAGAYANVTPANAMTFPFAQDTIYVYAAPSVTSTSAATVKANAGATVTLKATVTGTPTPDTTANTVITWQSCTPHTTTPVETCANTLADSGWTTVGSGVTSAANSSNTAVNTQLVFTAAVANSGTLYRTVASTISSSAKKDGSSLTAVSSAPSTPTTVTVYAKPTITALTGNDAVFVGSGTPATFTVTVPVLADSTWDAPVVTWAYQVGSNQGISTGAWVDFPSSIYTAWNPLTGKSTLTITNPPVTSSGLNIKAFVTNGFTANEGSTNPDTLSVAGTCGNTSYAVCSTGTSVLYVTAAPVFAASTQALSQALNQPAAAPTSYEVVEGGTSEVITLTLPGTSNNTNVNLGYTYQWYLNGTKVTGQTANAITVAANVANSGAYTCVVKATSTAASSANVTDTASFTTGAVNVLVDLGAWHAVTGATTPRYGSLSALLPNGDFWVGGGSSATGGLFTSELITPTSTASGAPATLPALSTARAAGASFTGASVANTHLGGTVTLLPAGNLLIAGGLNADGYAQTNIDFYTPGVSGAAGTIANATVGQLGVTAVAFSAPTAGQSAALLNNGTVLYTGGTDGSEDLFYATSYLYNPVTAAWGTAPGSLVTPRAYATTSVLPNGQVLVAGGQVSTANGGVTNTAEIYNPTLAGFSSTTATTVNPSIASSTVENMQSARIYDTATVIPPTNEMPSGAVVFAGGMDSNGNVLSSVEVYDVYTGVFYNLGNLSTPRMQHSATLLANRGTTVTAYATYATAGACYPYDAANNTKGWGNSATDFNTYPPISCYNILISGGANSTAPVATDEVITISGIGTYTTSAGYLAAAVAPVPTMTDVPSNVINVMAQSTSNASTTLLPDGAVLTVGGLTSSNFTPQGAAEYFGAQEDYSDAPSAITGGTYNVGALAASLTGLTDSNLTYYWTVTPSTDCTAVFTLTNAASITYTLGNGTGGTNACTNKFTLNLLVVNEFGISTLYSAQSKT